jgi:hypothetical protein
MKTLAESVKELEIAAELYATALRDILRNDAKLRREAQDYATHPDFERLRGAIDGARFAMLIATGMDPETARGMTKIG